MFKIYWIKHLIHLEAHYREVWFLFTLTAVFGHRTLNLFSLGTPHCLLWKCEVLAICIFSHCCSQVAGMRPRLCQSDTYFSYFEIETSDMKKCEAAPQGSQGSSRLPDPSDQCCCVIWGDVPRYVASSPDFSGLLEICNLSIILWIQESVPLLATKNPSWNLHKCSALQSGVWKPHVSKSPGPHPNTQCLLVGLKLMDSESLWVSSRSRHFRQVLGLYKM